MKTLLELITQRQSVRRYADRPVEMEKLMRCLEAARLAPSASNSQPWHFILVTDDALRLAIARATFTDIFLINRFTVQAPVMIVVTEEKPRLITRIGMQVKKKDWPLIDIGIAAEHLCLQATEEGLGTCMIAWFQEEKVRKILAIPGHTSVALLISLGYPADGYKLRPKTRKRLEDIVSFNSYH